ARGSGGVGESGDVGGACFGGGVFFFGWIGRNSSVLPDWGKRDGGWKRVNYAGFAAVHDRCGPEPDVGIEFDRASSSGIFGGNCAGYQTLFRDGLRGWEKSAGGGGTGFGGGRGRNGRRAAVFDVFHGRET